MEQFRDELETCETCRGHRVVRPTLVEVAVHWRERHPGILDTMRDAVFLELAVSFRMVDRG